MGIVVVYHPCGLAFTKVLKFDVKIWAVDPCTPILTTLTAHIGDLLVSVL